MLVPMSLMVQGQCPGGQGHQTMLSGFVLLKCATFD